MLKKTNKKTGKKAAYRFPRLRVQDRIVVLGVMGLVGFLLVTIRLCVIQLYHHKKYAKVAQSHLKSRHKLLAPRGAILDRNGEHMAVDLIHYSVAVRPGLIRNPDKAAQKISRIINMNKKEVRRKINQKKGFVYLGHRFSLKVIEELKALRLRGMIFDKKFSRYYPYSEIGAQMVGYCDFDNNARGGLELEYDRILSGKPGWSVVFRDALGNQFPNLDYPTSEPVSGMNLETTVDMVYQGILAEELRKGVITHKANNGSAVLLNPQSGEVLGIVNYPTFDANHYNRYALKRYRNRAITDYYEPGSTFKMISLAFCLEQLNLDLEREQVYCENGRYTLAKKVINDHKRFGYLNVRQIFEKSSNIGVIKLSKQFKAPVFYRYARDFGFGAVTGIDLPAESPGVLHKPAQYSYSSVAYMSIGYGVAVTPLQIATAYGAIANDGVLMQPYLVKRIVDENGRVDRENKPQRIRQVVSKKTAQRMKDILQGVVENGTGTTAQIAGLSIGGKSGTAQKLDQKTKSYSSDRHVASFVGFFPVESPRFVLLVMVNNPRKGYYGSEVAAPIFKNIAQRIVGLPDHKIARIDSRRLIQLPKLPDLKKYLFAFEGMELTSSIQLLEKNDVDYEVIGGGNVVYRQEPPAYSKIDKDIKVKLFTGEKRQRNKMTMPELTGLTLKEALLIIANWNINIEIKGNGTVTQQMPGAGKTIKSDTPIKLVCKPV